MLKIESTKGFKKDIQRDKKSGKYSKNDFEILKKIIKQIQEEKDIESIFKRHNLTNNLKDYEAIHVKNNWILIFKINDNTLTLVMLGTHTQVYKNKY
ncbi:type II toxin-antitoxin system YafQ family toxin [Candidatus Halobeggiatoa sp. HSG11]|nr:type II toxin-antitoxin system YafQ family toxin [Candidatus Halobeggiatoa sp. HSG11]